MAIIVEDGSGKADAESYTSVADADTYLVAHYGSSLSTAWSAAANSIKEIALRNATRYLDAVYGGRWKGVKRYSTQALDWPRYNVWDSNNYLLESDKLPKALKNACAEAALRSVAETLIPDIDEPGDIASESVKVGPIEESIEYLPSRSKVKKFRVIDLLLRQLIEGGGTKLVRV